MINDTQTGGTAMDRFISNLVPDEDKTSEDWKTMLNDEWKTKLAEFDKACERFYKSDGKAEE